MGGEVGRGEEACAHVWDGGEEDGWRGISDEARNAWKEE
jgi:hypothetical protein